MFIECLVLIGAALAAFFLIYREVYLIHKTPQGIRIVFKKKKYYAYCKLFDNYFGKALSAWKKSGLLKESVKGENFHFDESIFQYKDQRFIESIIRLQVNLFISKYVFDKDVNISTRIKIMRIYKII